MMKKALLSISLLMLLFFCKKDDENNSSKKEDVDKEELSKLEYVESIGRKGTKNGEFSDQGGSHIGWGLEVDGEYLYAADFGNSRVQRFKLSDHSFVDWFGYKDGEWKYNTVNEKPDNNDFDPVAVRVRNDKVYIFGKTGFSDDPHVTVINSTDDKLIKQITLENEPHFGFSGIAVDKSDNIFQFYDNIIYRYDYNDGSIKEQFGELGVDDGLFDADVSGIAVSDKNILYVLDAGNDKIQSFDVEGNFKNSFKINHAGGFYNSISLYDNHLYFIDDEYDFVKYNLEGQKINTWKLPSNDGFSSSSQFLVYGNTIYQFDIYNGEIDVYNFDNGY